MTKVTLDGVGPQCRRYVWGRKDEEFLADFLLITKRSLTEGEYKLFRFHYLLGADWRLCARKLGVDKGTFYHFVYRIQRKLGRAFRETVPYALFPLDEYFHGMQHADKEWAEVEASMAGEEEFAVMMGEKQPEPAKAAGKVIPIAPPVPKRPRRGSGLNGTGSRAA